MISSDINQILFFTYMSTAYYQKNKELLKKKLVQGIKIFLKNEKSKSLNRLMKYMKNLSKEEKEKTAKHRKNYYVTHKE